MILVQTKRASGNQKVSVNYRGQMNIQQATQLPDFLDAYEYAKLYNRAVEKGLVTQRFPFKHVYTGVERTTKRAVPLRVIKQLRTLDLSLHPAKRFARDMLLFSFYTRGMSMVDMAFLRKKDLANGILTYRRKKTGQQLFVKWEPCMQEIVSRYNVSESPYLLPIIVRPGMDERKQYINASHRINRYLKAIGKELGLSVPLTHYVARHSWASAAGVRIFRSL